MRRLYEQMARIEITPVWAKILDSNPYPQRGRRAGQRQAPEAPTALERGY